MLWLFPYQVRCSYHWIFYTTSYSPPSSWTLRLSFKRWNRLVVHSCCFLSYYPSIHWSFICSKLLCKRYWWKQRKDVGCMLIYYYFIHPISNLEFPLFLLLVQIQNSLYWNSFNWKSKEIKESLYCLEFPYSFGSRCTLRIFLMCMLQLFWCSCPSWCTKRRRSESPRNAKDWRMLQLLWWWQTRRNGGWKKVMSVTVIFYDQQDRWDIIWFELFC